MDKQQMVLAKYQTLVMEWNTISTICAIAFAATFLGLVFGLMFADMNVIVLSMVVMLVFSIFEYNTRKKYVHIKEELELEMFALSGMKHTRMKQLIRKGMWW